MGERRMCKGLVGWGETVGVAKSNRADGQRDIVQLKIIKGSRQEE